MVSTSDLTLMAGWPSGEAKRQYTSLQLSWLDTLKKEEPYEDSSFTGGLEQLEKLLKRYSVVGVESTLKPSI